MTQPRRPFLTVAMMALAASVLLAPAAQAACFADYKAKRDGPLRLHYGVIELPGEGCSGARAAAQAAAPRLAAGGWTLLNILSIFGAEGLAERKDRAGDFFLRF